MTEQTINTTAKTTETPTEPSADATTNDTDSTGANREAAKYRRQAREAETERDALREQLAAARSELLRTAVTNYKIEADAFDTAAFDDAGLNPESLFTDGKIDADKLTEHMAGLYESKPYMFNRPFNAGNVAPREGASVNPGKATSEWATAFSAGDND